MDNAIPACARCPMRGVTHSALSSVSSENTRNTPAQQPQPVHGTIVNAPHARRMLGCTTHSHVPDDAHDAMRSGYSCSV
eukprot:7370726-Prymnesium_polylepis.2